MNNKANEEKIPKLPADKKTKKKTIRVADPTEEKASKHDMNLERMRFSKVSIGGSFIDIAKRSSLMSKSEQVHKFGDRKRKSVYNRKIREIFPIEVDSSDDVFMSTQQEKIDKRMEMFLQNPKKILSSMTAYDSSFVFGKREKHLESDMFKTTESEIREFVIESLHVLGAEEENARIFATAIIEADKKGYWFEGLASFMTHILDITGKITLTNSKPIILAETGSTAWVDGNKALGPVIDKYCMEMAMAKALKTGVGIVSVNNVNSIGHGAWVSSLATERGFIGFKISNARPKMCPVGAMKAALGDNTLSFSAPVGYDYLHLEVTSTALSKETLISHLNSNEPLKADLAYGPDGKLSRDPKEIAATRRLLPLGLTRTLGSIKGYGLGIMLEALTGILSGSNYGPFLKESYELDNESTNYGQCYIAVDPNCFSVGFEGRLARFLDEIRNLPPLTKSKPVIIPGELENYRQTLTQKLGGMLYPKSVMETTKLIAEKLQVPRLKFKTLRV